MLKKTILSAFLSVFCSAAAPHARAAAVIGQPAPDFTLSDPQGKSHTLSAEKGKYVVLEWFNDGCPFVRKHYDSGNMQKLQTAYAQKGVTWYSVLSSAPGTEGYAAGADAAKLAAKNKSKATALLLDSEGRVGRLYGAKTTPHMYIVDPKGVLIYKGGIDDKPSTDQADIAGAKNYVQLALDEAMAGKPVSVSESRPYGCSVKYK